MEELQKLIKDMQKDFSNKFNSIETQFGQLEERITSSINTNINEKFGNLTREVEMLKCQLETQEKRLNVLERDSKQRNLVFFGIEEGESSYSQLQDKVIDTIANNIKVDIENSDVEVVRRIGKPGDGTRPVSVRLTTLRKKICILKNKKELKGSQIGVSEEFPPEILNKRKELKILQQEEIKKGNIAFIKYDKLIVKEKSKKRTLSSTSSPSPGKIQNETASNSTEITEHNSNYITQQRNKKLKSNSITNFMNRKIVTTKTDNAKNS